MIKSKPACNLLAVYHGEFRSGVVHGRGSIASQYGSSYEGYWEEGSRTYGQQKYCDGRSFTGYFVNDIPDIYGTLVYLVADRRMLYSVHFITMIILAVDGDLSQLTIKFARGRSAKYRFIAYLLRHLSRVGFNVPPNTL